MVNYIIKTQNGRDKPRYGVAMFSHDPKTNKQEAEFMLFYGNKTFATLNNAKRYWGKRGIEGNPKTIKW